MRCRPAVSVDFYPSMYLQLQGFGHNVYLPTAYIWHCSTGLKCCVTVTVCLSMSCSCIQARVCITIERIVYRRFKAYRVDSVAYKHSTRKHTKFSARKAIICSLQHCLQTLEVSTDNNKTLYFRYNAIGDPKLYVYYFPNLKNVHMLLYARAHRMRYYSLYVRSHP